VPTTATFGATGDEEDFWSGFYAAVRDARRDLAEAGHINLNEDEDRCPPFVTRLA
jgi:hypothetical protein